MHTAQQYKNQKLSADKQYITIPGACMDIKWSQTYHIFLLKNVDVI